MNIFLFKYSFAIILLIHKLSPLACSLLLYVFITRRCKYGLKSVAFFDLIMWHFLFLPLYEFKLNFTGLKDRFFYLQSICLYCRYASNLASVVGLSWNFARSSFKSIHQTLPPSFWWIWSWSLHSSWGGISCFSSVPRPLYFCCHGGRGNDAFTVFWRFSQRGWCSIRLCKYCY